MDLFKDLKLKDLQVIGQSAGREVIFCYHRKKRRILCFDQHAADERIRYEQILDSLEYVDNLDHVKSRACHGAVRFGDKLTIDQCYDLIGRLLRCKVPFQCAHARCGVCMLQNLDVVLFNEKKKMKMKKKIDIEQGELN